MQSLILCLNVMSGWFDLKSQTTTDQSYVETRSKHDFIHQSINGKIYC